MFHDTVEPTEILHYAYLNIRIVLIDFSTENAVTCPYRKLNHVYFHGCLVPSECWFVFLKLQPFWYRPYCRSIDLWLLYLLPEMNTIRTLFIRWFSLALVVLSIWEQIAADLMFLKLYGILKSTISKYCVQKLSRCEGWWFRRDGPSPRQTLVKLKAVGVDPKSIY
jgi:hypothetical protein